MSPLVLGLLVAVACGFPSLDDLGSDWVEYSTYQYGVQVQLPVINTFLGGVGLNDDLLSVTWRFPPFFNGRNSNPGVNYASVEVDGQVPVLQQHRWRAYEGARDSTVQRGIQIKTRTRMVHTEMGILHTITIVNNGSATDTHNVTFALTGLLGAQPYGEGWNIWGYCPASVGCLNSTNGFDFSLQNGMVLVEPTGKPPILHRNYTYLNNTDSLGPNLGNAGTDNITALKIVCDSTPGCMGFNSNGWLQSQVVNDVPFQGSTLYCAQGPPLRPGKEMAGFVFADIQPSSLTLAPAGIATFQLDIPRGTSVTLKLAYALDADAASLQERLAVYQGGFDVYWDAAQTQWEAKWEGAFTEGNPYFSGFMPTLDTPDDAMERIYYHSILTELSLMRNYVPNPVVAPNIITTIEGHTEGGPVLYYWDDSFTSFTSALLIPKETKMKLQWLLSGSLEPVEVDTYAGLRFAPGYAFDTVALFESLATYLQVTGDLDFLYEQVNGLMVTDWLEALATTYLNQTMRGPYLADYGPNPATFLEVISTYVHVVPALQASNAYMLRTVADLRVQEGNFTRAAQLNANASGIASATVNQLWVQGGGGVWGCLYPNGTLVPVRHVVDFGYIARAIPDDIPTANRQEMIHFFETELKTIRGDWLRALSPLDKCAPVFREDHGSTGAYGAWPAIAIEALALLDVNFTRALSFLHGIEAPSYLGPIGQANGVINTWISPNTQVPAFKTSGGGDATINASGGSYADIIIRAFFGFAPGWFPDINTPSEMLSRASINREFVGTLSNIRTPMGQATITSSSTGLAISIVDGPGS